MLLSRTCQIYLVRKRTLHKQENFKMMMNPQLRVGQVSENRLISLQSHILQMSFLVSFTHQQGIHNPEPSYEPSWATSSPRSSTRFYSICMSNNMLLQSCIIGRVLNLTKSTWFWNRNKEVYFALRIKTSNDRQKKCIQLAKNCKSK